MTKVFEYFCEYTGSALKAKPLKTLVGLRPLGYENQHISQNCYKTVIEVSQNTATTAPVKFRNLIQRTDCGASPAPTNPKAGAMSALAHFNGPQ